MIIKVIRRNRPDCVKVTNNNVTKIGPSVLSSTIEDVLKYWKKLDDNAVRLNMEDLAEQSKA